MGKLLVFELKRFWKNKKNWMVLALLPMILVSFICINNSQDKSYQEWFRKQIYTERTEANRQVFGIKVTQSNFEEIYEETGNPDYLELIEECKRQLKIQEKWFTISTYILNKRNVNERLSYEIERDELLLSRHEEGQGNISFNLYNNAHPETLYAQLEVKRHLRQNSITPLSSPYEMTGHNFLSRMFAYPGFLIWLAVATFLTIDVFPLDITSGTYKNIYTTPYKRSSILLAKWFSSVINVLGVFIVCTVAFTTYFYVSSNFGNRYYPIMFGSSGIIPWSSAILYQLPMFLLTLILTVTLVQFITMQIKETNESFVVILSIVLFDFIIRGFIPLNNKFWYIYPLSGLDIQGVFSSNMNQGFWLLAQVTVLLTIIGLGVISITKFRREDL